MVEITRAQAHVLRIAVAAVSLLVLLVYFDPLGFASSSASVPGSMPGMTRSVTHIVMYQFKHDADQAAVEVACARLLELKDSCLAPNSQYPYIKRVKGGRDNSREGLQNGHTHAFIVQFDNANDRDYYVEKDPVHQAFKNDISPLVEKVTVLDFTNGKF